MIRERRSHPTPERGRTPTSKLSVEWPCEFRLAAGQALGSTSCSLLLLFYVVSYMTFSYEAVGFAS